MKMSEGSKVNKTPFGDDCKGTEISVIETGIKI